jgi:hypothetical protein
VWLTPASPSLGSPLPHETTKTPEITDEIRRLAELVLAEHPAWEKHALFRTKSGQFVVRGFDVSGRVLGEVHVSEPVD